MDTLLYFSVVYSATFLLYRRYTHVYRLFMYHQQIILSGACFKSTVDVIIKPLCKTVCDLWMCMPVVHVCLLL